jgi:tryptophan 2,3-dioxygenase
VSGVIFCPDSRWLSTNPVDDEAMARIVHSFARIHEILKLLVAQLDVLETMTPADFLDFRDYLFPASGFQSLQFRLIETRLGLQESSRVQLDGEAVEKRLSVADRQKLAAARARPTILALLDIWLARTPFLDWGGESFRVAYREAVVRHLAADVETRSRPTLRFRPSVGNGRSRALDHPARDGSRLAADNDSSEAAA